MFTIFLVMSTSAQPIPSPPLTPANSIGGHLNCRASDQYAYPTAGVHVVSAHQLHNVGHREPTRDNLHSLDTERICVNLSHSVYLVPRSIKGLEPEDHRLRWARSVVELLIQIISHMLCDTPLAASLITYKDVYWNKQGSVKGSHRGGNRSDEKSPTRCQEPNMPCGEEVEDLFLGELCWRFSSYLLHSLLADFDLTFGVDDIWASV